MKGHGYRDIGRHVGLSDGAVRARVLKMLAGMAEQQAREWKHMASLELHRLERLLPGLEEKAMAGHGPSIDRVLAISRERRAIMGIDAPKRTFHDILVTDQPAELTSEQILQALKEQGVDVTKFLTEKAGPTTLDAEFEEMAAGDDQLGQASGGDVD